MAGDQTRKNGEPPSDPAGPSGLARDDFLVGLPKDGDTPVIGPVKLEAKISRGGMGVVYRGHHVKLDIDVAVKVLSPYLASHNPEYVLRFEREAESPFQ